MPYKPNSNVISVSGTQSVIDFGAVTLNWTGTINSGQVTITHKLGRVPKVILITPHDTGNPSIVPSAQAAAVTNLQFTMSAVSQGAGTYAVDFCWLAIG